MSCYSVPAHENICWNWFFWSENIISWPFLMKTWSEYISRWDYKSHSSSKNLKSGSSGRLSFCDFHRTLFIFIWDKWTGTAHHFGLFIQMMIWLKVIYKFQRYPTVLNLALRINELETLFYARSQSVLKFFWKLVIDSNRNLRNRTFINVMVKSNQ